MLAAIAAVDYSFLIQNYHPYLAKRSTINLEHRKNEWFSCSPQRLRSRHDSNRSRSGQNVEWSLHSWSFVLYSVRKFADSLFAFSSLGFFPQTLPLISIIGQSLFSVSRDFPRRLSSINTEFLLLYFFSRGLLCYRYRKPWTQFFEVLLNVFYRRSLNFSFLIETF